MKTELDFVKGSTRNKPGSSKGGKYSTFKSRRAVFGTLKSLTETSRGNGFNVLASVATDLFSSLNTPISLSCEILLRYNELEQLVQRDVSPSNYLDPYKFRKDRQAVAFLKKTPLKINNVDPEASARIKFYEAEEQCRKTNSQFRNFLSDPTRVSAEMLKSFSIVQRKIQEVLGTEVYHAEWMNSCRFGPGVFHSDRKTGTTSHYDKLQVNPSVTFDFSGPGDMLVKSSPAWVRSITGSTAETQENLCIPIPGNKVAFVPKTALTHRPIAIEPLINIYAQLGLGGMIRRRLRRKTGIDLDDQSPNQRAAEAGSKSGKLCTIDLSSASDTLAREVVRAVMVPTWFSCLDICRSKVGYIDGKWLRYEKFSSMGNGFTFELETLIFWAIVCSACEIIDTDDSDVLVYGDDIVVPVEAAELAIELLKWYGFTPNRDKTFIQGPFRESCGSDWFDGVQVRPFYQKEVPDEINHLFKLANGLRRKAGDNSDRYDRCSYLHSAWSSVARFIPRVVREQVVGPASASPTSCLHVSWDTAQRSPFVVPLRDCLEGFAGVGLLPVPLPAPKVTNFEGAVATLLYRLNNGGADEATDPAPLRQGRGSTQRLRKCAFYGPWTDPFIWS